MKKESRDILKKWVALMNGIPFSKDLLKGMHKELNEKGLFDDYEKWRLTKRKPNDFSR